MANPYVRRIMFAGQGVLLAGIFGVGVYQWIQGNRPLAFPLIGFSLLAGSLLVFAVQRTTESEADDQSGDDPEEKAEIGSEPWTARPEWRTRTLTFENETDWSSLVGPVISNLFAWPGGLAMIYYAVVQPHVPLGFAFVGLLVIGVLGIYVGWVGVRKVLRQQRFNASQLTLDTMPARLGDSLDARLLVPASPDVFPGNGFTAELTCERHYLTETPDIEHTGGESRNRSRTVQKWKEEHAVTGHPVGPSKDRTEVPISFDLPANQPPSTPERSADRIAWTLRVTSNLSGIDYEATFEVPVFEVDEGVAGRQEDTSEDQPKTDIPTERRETEAKPDALDRANESPISRSDHVDVKATSDERLQVKIAPGGGLKVAGFPGVVGLVLAGLAGAMASLGAGVVVTGAIGLASAPLLYVSLRRYTFSGEVTVEDGRVAVQSGAFGFNRTHEFPSSLVEDADVTMRGSVGNAANYVLLIRLKDSVDERSAKAKGVAEDVFEKVRATGAKGMMKQTENYEREIKVGEALDHKPAAERAAELIRMATNHQARDPARAS